MSERLLGGRLATIAALLLGLSMLGVLGGATSAAARAWGRNYFPNVPLVTQEGKTVLFYDDLIEDKKVLINFIYETCEKACPLATAKMAQIQKALGSRVGRDIFIYSITLEPEHDTPEVLKAYAERYKARPGWLFLTGKREHIDAVRYKLGERDDEKENHNNIIRIGDGKKGHWMRLPMFGEFNYLVNEIGKTLDPNWYAGRSVDSYAEAQKFEGKGPELGQILFENRCSACHTIGNGDRMGPDLVGVTARREPLWLARFIAAPDEMRALKDPIAEELSAKFSEVPMPNLELTTTNVADLIDYLGAENRRLEEAQRMKLQGHH